MHASECVLSSKRVLFVFYHKVANEKLSSRLLINHPSLKVPQTSNTARKKLTDGETTITYFSDKPLISIFKLNKDRFYVTQNVHFFAGNTWTGCYKGDRAARF